MEIIKQAVNTITEIKTDDNEKLSTDRFLEVMEPFTQEAKKNQQINCKKKKLNNSLESMSTLAAAFGESKEITLQEFIKYFTDFLDAWGKSRESLRKMEAEKKKKEKMEAKKTKLEAKLVKRESKQALQDKGVLKSKKKAKQEKQQKNW